MTAKSVVKFFKDNRDVSIHEKPVSPTGIFKLAIAESVYVSESLSVKATAAGTISATSDHVEWSAASALQESEVSATFGYYFEDWPGTEDVITLCKMYLTEVEAIVTDGLLKSFLTP